MATLVNLTYDLADLIGTDYDPRHTRVFVKTNITPDPVIVVDGTTMRLGDVTQKPDADGTGEFTGLIATNSAENPTSFAYRFIVQFNSTLPHMRGKKQTWTSSEFPLTASANIAAIPEAFDGLSVPVSWRSDFRDEMEAIRDEATVITGIDSTDSAVAALVETAAGPLTQAALGTAIENARHSNTLAMMGDSFLANTLIYEAGPLAWQHKPSAMLTGGRILLGQRLELVKDAGISGNTTTQMLARYDTDITPYGAGWVFIGGGTNDVDGGASAATIIANLTAMFDKADRDHARIIAATIPPRDANTAPKNAVLFEVNEWIRREAFVRPGMVLVDLYAVLSEPTAATFKSGISLDGIHPYTTAGGWRMARAFYDALKDVVPPVPVLPSSNVDSRSLITCGMFTGTAGGKGTGVTGTTASGWFVEPAPSLTCTATVAKVARTDLGPGDMQEIEVTAGTAQARARNTAVGTAWNPGDEVYATIGFEADTLPTTPAASVFDLNVTCYNAGFSRLLRGVDNGLMAYEFEALNIPASGVLRTPSIVIPALTTTLQITVTMSAGAKVRLYQAELVKGSWL